MSAMSRRTLLSTTAGAAAGLAVGGCGDSGAGKAKEKGEPGPAPAPGGGEPTGPAATTTGPVVIGDGSTARTGPQPHQPEVDRLEPGQTPPQFVVFSWDGAGEVGNGLFPRFLKLASEHGASMTFFLSGLYLLPEGRRQAYAPPNNPLGASDIGYLTDEHVRLTLDNLRRAWWDGHEIGTHFNGHFCAGSGSVGRWTPADWLNEIEQAKRFVTQWKTHTGWHDQDPLPFDYDQELVGGRTPCLLGQDNLLPTARDLGWRYDASSPGGNQVWPSRRGGLWDLPLQLIPFPGHRFEVLSMDYNMLANQSRQATRSDPANYPGWRRQATDSYIAGFQRAYETNRAPFYIGNHFEQWNGGIYMDAVEETFKHIAAARRGSGDGDVRLVSFRQFVDWLDAQDPALLDRLRTLEVGERPPGGWRSFLAPGSAPSSPAAPPAASSPGTPGTPGTPGAPDTPGTPGAPGRSGTSGTSVTDNAPAVTT